MSKHIGIIGVSSEGAALCFRTICLEGAEMLGRHGHPEVSMHLFPLSQYMEPADRGDWDSVGALLLATARKLVGLGAEILVCPDNTVHRAFDFASERVDVPWIHIAEVVADEAVERGFRQLGILGTRHLMEGPVYPSRLETRGLDFRIPDDADRARVDSVIFDELVAGEIADGSRREFVEIIDRLRDTGCDAVVLGCTEIPLLIDDSVSPLPTLDSTRLLARAALRLSTA
jgi:aspartate racemase